MPFAGFKNWDECMNDKEMKEQYPEKDTREKVCGKLQAEHEDFTRASEFESREACIETRSEKIRKTHPNLSEKEIKEMAEERCKGVNRRDYISANSRCYLLGLRKSFDDYAELPTSILISKAVNDNLHRLQEKNPDLDKKELLQLAYDIARRENPITSDFVDDVAPSKPRDPKNPEDPESIDDPEKFFAAEEAVSSSNVAEVGFGRTRSGKNQLIVYFNNGAGYAYDVGPKKYKEMMNAGSKGSFVWEELRGKEPGYVIDKPSKMTPGGVGGSIVPYSKIKGAQMSFTKMEAMKNKVLGEKKAELKEKEPKEASKEWKAIWKEVAKRQQKLEAAPLKSEGEAPAEEGPDPTLAILRKKLKKLQAGLQATDSEIVKQAIQRQIDEIQRQLERYQDFVWLGNIVNDMSVIDDSTILYGPITRGGEFVYGDTIKKKDYNQLKEVMGEVNHLPTFDSHNEDRLIGFAYDWVFDDDEERVYGHVQTFKDIQEISALREDLQDQFPVSIRFFDKSKSDDLYQDIERVLHLAMSVDKTEQDRCSASGGKPCYVSRADFTEKPSSDGCSSRSITKNNGPAKIITQDYNKTMTEKEKEEEKEKVDDEEDEDEDDEEKDKKAAGADFEEEDDEEDFVKISTEEYEKLKATDSRLKQMEDFVGKLKKQEQARKKKEEIDLRAELAKDPRVKSDFLEDKGLKELKIIQDSLTPLEDDNDGAEIPLQKGIKDFETQVSDFKKQYQKKWSTAGGN